MKKKISLIFCLVIMTLTFAACGTDPTTVSYYGVSYSDFLSTSENNIAALVAMGEDELNSYAASDSEIVANLTSTWQEATADLGAYQGLGEFTVTKAQTTVSTEQVIHFEKRDAVISFVYEYNYETEQLELTDANTDLVYTVGEKMEKAALNTLIGMGTVFIVLILISLIIWCFRYISKFDHQAKPKETAAVLTQIEQRETQQTDDLELAAVIAAAIAASTGTSTDSFVVRSIHRR